MAHDGWKDWWKTDEQEQDWLRSRKGWACEAGFHCEDCLSVLDAPAAKSASSAAKGVQAAVGQLSEHGAGWRITG